MGIKDLNWLTEEQQKEKLKERIASWRKGYSRDGFITVAENTFSYKNVPYVIKALRYYNHTGQFTPMDDRKTDLHFVVESTKDLEEFADKYEKIIGGAFLWHDTMHCIDQDLTAEEQYERIHQWAKESIDFLYYEAWTVAQKKIEEINDFLDEMNKVMN